ncbi:MAG: mobilization protein, partial [Oscillospiraceae bacterium]
KLSGMTKQDYIIDRLNNKEIIVNPNPRVFKALKNEIIALTEELERLSQVSEGSEELVEMTKVVVGMVERLRG